MIKKILKIIFYIFLLLIILVNVLSSKNRSLFGFRTFTIASGSMNPYLEVNDLILIKSSNNYKINDIITFKLNDDYITHRIIDIKDDYYVTKGDANNTEDAPVRERMIVGKLIYKFRLFGFVNYLFQKPIAWILLFIVGFLITFLLPDKN